MLGSEKIGEESELAPEDVAPGNANQGSEMIPAIESEGILMGGADGKIDFPDVGQPKASHEILHQPASDPLMLVVRGDVDVKMGLVRSPEMAGQKIGFLQAVAPAVRAFEDREVFLLQVFRIGFLIEGRKDIAHDFARGGRDEAMALLFIEVIIGVEKIKGFWVRKKERVGAGFPADLPNLREILDRGFPDQNGFHQSLLLNSLSTSWQ
jgi:hypothetical protein